METMKARKLRYFGHVMRLQQDSFEKDIMEGTMPGTRRRGRPRMSWRDNIETWTGLTMEETIRNAQNRDLWRRVVHIATKLRSEDG